MKRLFVLAAMTALSATAFADPNVGVSVNIGQPGFYGRIDIGNVPQPQVIYSQPVIVQPVPVNVAPPPPVYMRVPPGYEKHWSKHCREYGACGQPVYFVHDSWYRNVYVPQYRGRGDEYRGHDHGHGDHDDRGRWHDDRGHGHDDRRDDRDWHRD